MKKKRYFWTILIVLSLTVFCGVSVFAAVFIYQYNSSPSSGFGDAIAIIPVEGIITSGYPSTNLFGDLSPGAYSDYIVEQLQEVDADEQVKVVILWVNSPGGGVLASDVIHKQVAAMSKPIIVSMGTLAASGGYYISAPADEIWAHRHTLTGSIGVIIQFFDFSGFMEEYGLELNVIKSGTNKDNGGFHRAMTAEEYQIWQTLIDDSYDVFVEVVTEGRDLEEATVRKFADGRIYSAKQAQDLGLVDRIGDLEAVIERAIKLGNIEDESPRLIDYRRISSSPFNFSALLRPTSPLEDLKELLSLHTPPTLMYLYDGF